MTARSRFSTGTVVDSKHFVPWLAAAGPLAYSSAEPPTRDYFFQYTWIRPQIFDQAVNLRERRYFGSPLKYDADFLFDFWTKVRNKGGAALPRYCVEGSLTLYQYARASVPLMLHRYCGCRAATSTLSP